MWQNGRWLYKQLLPIHLQTAWNRQMNFPNPRSIWAVSKIYGQYSNHAHIITYLQKMQTGIYWRYIRRKPYLRAFDRSNDQLHMTWCWKKQKILAFRRSRSCPSWRMMKQAICWKAAEEGEKCEKTEARVTYEILYKLVFWQLHVFESKDLNSLSPQSSLSTSCRETNLCVGEQFPSVLSILKSKSGLRDKNIR